MTSLSPHSLWLTVAIAATGLPAAAQDAYPAKPITLVVPFGAGSGTDLVTRLVGKSLQESLGVPVVVENKPGANGAIAAASVARSKPDGHTLLVGSATTNAANFAFFPGKLGYTPESFDIVSGLSASPISLYVPIDSPWKSLADLKAASQQPGRALTCGSGNAVTQVACEVFRLQTSLPMTNVPYKSNPNSLIDVAGGQISFAFSDAGAAQPLLEGKRLRPLAVAATQRHAAYPDTPTFEELGVPHFEFTGWIAVFAPAGTPAPVLEKLHPAIQKAITSPEAKQFLERSGSVAKTMSLAESRRFAAGEVARWSRYIKESHVKPEQ